ncbi:hypothetical protein Cfor_06727 [Coptotermes formosanus]|uniref:Chitin-binding type-2 domain-containing protein n=1 Tax=Coptotermes formosanus TaxID=36987 RepID=A0A6L2PNZ8_COPFO|nr:hypothetical protein Cfor_06727 [Coptotermes formosanus]
MDGTGTYDADSQVCRVTPCSGPPTTDATTPAPFTCPAVGLFADPTNCHNYYACDQDLKAIPGTCLKGNGTFDPVNQVCTTAPCPGTFVCSSAGVFADPADCHGFYVCDGNLNPTHGSCTSAAYFDPTLICVVGPCVQTSPTTTTPAPVTNTPFECTTAGYFADPKDCHSYYVCDSSLSSSHHTCMGGGGYFDPDAEGCYHDNTVGSVTGTGNQMKLQKNLPICNCPIKCIDSTWTILGLNSKSCGHNRLKMWGSNTVPS